MPTCCRDPSTTRPALKKRAQEKTGGSGRDDTVTIVTREEIQSENLKRMMHQRACTPSFQVIFFPSSYVRPA